MFLFAIVASRDPLSAEDPFDELLRMDASSLDQPRGLAGASSSGGTAGGHGQALVTSVTVDPLTGAATTSIPVMLPPGRLRMTPALAATYASQRKNGVMGQGWDIGLGRIERNTTAGVPLLYPNSPQPADPSFDDSLGFRLITSGGVVKLDTSVGMGCWKPSVEEVPVEACVVGNTWEVEGLDGKQMVFGGTLASRAGRKVDQFAKTFS